MANGYSQTPSGRNTQNNSNENEEESYRFGNVSFGDNNSMDGFHIMPDGSKMRDSDMPTEPPFVEEVNPTPPLIQGKIKFQKTIYSQTAFARKVDTSINELRSKVEKVDIEKFFKEYNKIFFDIPQQGINSHTTIIKESKDYVDDYVDYKDVQISDLEQQVEELELQILELQESTINPETGETEDSDIGNLLTSLDRQQIAQDIIGDVNNPMIAWNNTALWPEDLLNWGLKKRFKQTEQSWRTYDGAVSFDGNEREKEGRDIEQAKSRGDANNIRSYNQWKTDIEKKSSGKSTTNLLAFLDWYKGILINQVQSIGSE